MNDSAEKGKPPLSQEVFFWCCAVVSLMALLGTHSLFWMEPSVAEAAREIVVTGKWYPFTINFEPRPDLPILEVWSIALVFKLSLLLKIGISEFAARLPSALAALGLLLGVTLLAKRLFDRTAALLAGWMTLGSFGVLFLGRGCYFPGTFSAMIAVWIVVLYLYCVRRRSFWLYLLWGVVWTLGILNRGLLFLGLSVALLIPWMNGYRIDLDRKFPIAALLSVALLYLAWWFVFGEPVSAVAHWVDGRLGDINFRKVWDFLAANREARMNLFFTKAFICSLPMIIMPWLPIGLTAFFGTLFNMQKLPREDRCLLWSIVLGLTVLSLPMSPLRTDLLPLVPFAALMTGVWLLRVPDRSINRRWSIVSRWSVIAVRSVLMVLAACGVVSPLTATVWKPLLNNFELPVLFWTAAFLFGGAVLLIMMLDSYPGRPLSRLTGLPRRLVSPVLGGTLLSICLLSFLMPSVCELWAEKQFLLDVRKRIAAENVSVFNIGDRDSTAKLLFYTGSARPVTWIGKYRADGRKNVLAGDAGAKVAVVAALGGEDEKILRRVVEAERLGIDLGKPEIREATPPDCGLPYRPHACWLVTVPERPAAGK